MTDIKININTQDGINKFTTERMKGEFRGLLINAEKPVNVLIESELGYEILSKLNFIGKQFMMLQFPTHSPIGNPYTDHVGFCFLDEKLVITVDGLKNNDVEFLFRVI